MLPVFITDNVTLTKQEIDKSPRLPNVARSSSLVLLSILPNNKMGSSLEASDVYQQRSVSEGKWSPRQWEQIIAFPQHVKSTDTFPTFLRFYSEVKTFTKVKRDNFSSNYICPTILEVWEKSTLDCRKRCQKRHRTVEYERWEKGRYKTQMQEMTSITKIIVHWMPADKPSKASCVKDPPQQH